MLDLFKSRHLKKRNKILFYSIFFLLLFSITSFARDYTIDYNNFLTRSITDPLYCFVDGSNCAFGGGAGIWMVNTYVEVNTSASGGVDNVNISGDLYVMGTVGNFTHRYTWNDLNATGSSTGDNTSWNETHANTLYTPISFNRTLADNLYTNDTDTTIGNCSVSNSCPLILYTNNVSDVDTNESSFLDNVRAENCIGEVLVDFLSNGSLVCESDDTTAGAGIANGTDGYLQNLYVYNQLRFNTSSTLSNSSIYMNPIITSNASSTAVISMSPVIVPEGETKVSYSAIGGYIVINDTTVWLDGTSFYGLDFGTWGGTATLNGNENVEYTGIRTFGTGHHGQTMLGKTTTGIEVYPFFDGWAGTGNINESYGINIKDNNIVFGSFTGVNQTQLNIEQPTGATNNYQVVLEGNGTGTGIWLDGKSGSRIYSNGTCLILQTGTTELRVCE